RRVAARDHEGVVAHGVLVGCRRVDLDVLRASLAGHRRAGPGAKDIDLVTGSPEPVIGNAKLAVFEVLSEDECYACHGSLHVVARPLAQRFGGRTRTALGGRAYTPDLGSS